MNTAVALTQLVDLAGRAAAVRVGTEPVWLTHRRNAARNQLAERGFPGRAHEAWRYTRLDTLLAEPFALPDDSTPDSAPTLPGAALVEKPAARLVFRDGHFDAGLSTLDRLPAGIALGSLREQLRLDPQRVGAILGAVQGDANGAFECLNTALIDDGLWLEADAGITLDAPIEILYTTSPDTGKPARLISPRNVVRLGHGAGLTLVEHYAGSGHAFNNSVTEISLAASASLKHYRLQNEDIGAAHKSVVAIDQAAASRYRGTTASLGARWSRTDYRVEFQDEGAGCHIDGLFLAGDGQLNDIHLDIDHAVPGCESREHVKGLLFGAGRGVFDGRVRVAAHARQTRAHLKNDNLLLSRDAEIDTKPQLEIYADDVQCSHGTTVGQLDEEQLHYLRSRGIDARTARRLLCNGFALEVMKNCPPGFAETVGQVLSERL